MERHRSVTLPAHTSNIQPVFQRSVYLKCFRIRQSFKHRTYFYASLDLFKHCCRNFITVIGNKLFRSTSQTEIISKFKYGI